MREYSGGRRQLCRLVLILLLACLALFPAHTLRAASKKKISVLMIGNSQTYSVKANNKTIYYLKKLGEAGGFSLSVTHEAYDKEKLKNFANASTRRGKQVRKQISRKKWDVIILQEHTNWAIARRNTFLKAAKKLASYIRKNCPDAAILLDATWAYDRVKKVEGVRYTKKTQQKKINENYKYVAKAIGAEVIWSGKTFAAYEKRPNTWNVYRRDKNHASLAGCFLHACCLYKGITNKNPREVRYYGPMIPGKAQTMQRVANEYARK